MFVKTKLGSSYEMMIGLLNYQLLTIQLNDLIQSTMVGYLAVFEDDDTADADFEDDYDEDDLDDLEEGEWEEESDDDEDEPEDWEIDEIDEDWDDLDESSNFDDFGDDF